MEGWGVFVSWEEWNRVEEKWDVKAVVDWVRRRRRWGVGGVGGWVLDEGGAGVGAWEVAGRVFVGCEVCGEDCDSSEVEEESSGIGSTNPGYCLRMISYCSRTNAAFCWRSVTEVLQTCCRRVCGVDRSRGSERVSSGGAMSMAAKRDWSQWRKVSILKHERRNWSVSARTRITYFFLYPFVRNPRLEVDRGGTYL